MQGICVKLDSRILKNLDKSLKEHNYSTRTDFIREAIRDKMSDLKKQKALQRLSDNFGKARTKTPLEEDRKIREQVSLELAQKYGIDLD